MTNLITNSFHQIDPSSTTGTVPYIATLFYNFAVQFGVLPFFLLVLTGVILTIVGFFVWNKFIRKENTTLSIHDIELLVMTAQQPTIEKISQILENIRSHLRTDEVVIVLRLAENYIAFELIDICRSLQDNAALTDAELKYMFESQSEACITLLDRELVKLPNITTAVVSPEEKIRTLKLKTEEFIRIIKTEKRQDALRKSVETIVKLLATQYWYR